MYDILTCLAFEHDHRLVALAALLCALSSVAAMALLNRAQRVEGSARIIWFLSGGVAGGFGIWATHFVAMLAYDPGVVVGYDKETTLLSLLMAIAATAAASGIAACRFTLPMAAVAGTVFGLGISAMHFTGMTAIEFPGRIEWNGTLASVAIAAAAALSILAFATLRWVHGRGKAIAAASLCLTFAIVSMHFTAMGAVTVVPDPHALVEENILSPLVMAVTIVTIALSLLFSGITAALFAVRAETAVAVGRRDFGLLVNGVTDYALYMIDPDGSISSWNAGAERNMGYSEAEILGRHVSCFYTGEDQDEGLPQAQLERALAAGKLEAQGWRLRKDGSRFWAHVVINTITDKQGQVIGFAQLARDCTEQRLADAKLRKTSDDLNIALSNMANALTLFDEDERLVMHNSRLNEYLGIDPERDLRGITLADLCQMNPVGAEERLNAYRGLIKRCGGEVVLELPSGNFIRVTFSPTATTAYVMTIEDVTTRIRSERRVNHMARHDALTGLPNRRQFMETLAERIVFAEKGDQRIAIFNIDLDRFKEINDSYGHATGDEVLCRLSERMTAELGEGEIVARFGGDEFVAAKSYRRDAELHDFVTRLTGCFTQTISIDANELSASASFGISVYPLDTTDPEKLLSNADMAMYRAKESFERKVCFYEASMDEAERARRSLAKDIWTGLREGQFFLNYQIQRAAADNSLTGYEVLLRWQHPQHGLVSPAVFIPVAEECGAIGAIGEWVLAHACRDAAAWPGKEKIAVNLSPLQLSNPQLVGRVREILLSTGLSPERLELEVTESAIIGDKTRALHILRQIKAMGVTIAIDDFGTGYSSLETLRAFPFDKIKLDRSFVSDLDTDRQALAFVRAILALGKSLEIPVLAEGIETEVQRDILTREGCDQFQGYLFGRPARLENIENLGLPDLRKAG